MKECIQRPLTAISVAAYLAYCAAGLVASWAMNGSLSGDAFSMKGKLVLLALRLWPYPMLECLGWRVNPESLLTWVAADLAGLLVVVAFTLGVERVLGPERRHDPRYIPATLVGVAVALLVAEFAVVAALRISQAQG